MALMISGVPNVTDQGFTNADNAAALEKEVFPFRTSVTTSTSFI